MSALFGSIIRVFLQVLAGVGVGHVMDKIASDKVPNYEPVAPDLTPWKAGFKPVKLISTVVAIALGGWLITFVARKLKIRSKFLK